ncbi:zinc finger BED domain-containing protein 5-like [Sipha flava]|jgi:hypothetical protein|uniref:Zinc finger BED domain-containing protein 5-like n=1 Tax=Sipha flava TaxID=143950 RepID=A0A8B8G7Y5_9HEMI|nr:zinc finger BED domain-containing protein 5-like [Sipha flava]
MDESTDVSGLSILLFFTHTHKKTTQEELLICESLKTRTTGEEIFDVLNKYLVKKKISWQKCVDVCTDGAATIVGKIKGVITRIKEVAPKCSNSHCVLYRHALATKKFSPYLKSALDVGFQCVKFLKSRPLKTKLFKKLCEEMGSDHQNLLLHTEIRWLSRGKVLTRLFELRNEVNIFLKEHTKTNL